MCDKLLGTGDGASTDGWVADYLSDRAQCVWLRNTVSDAVLGNMSATGNCSLPLSVLSLHLSL